MKKSLSILLCLLLLALSCSAAISAATLDSAAVGDDDCVNVCMYLDPNSEFPIGCGEYEKGSIPVRPDDPGHADPGMTFVDWYTDKSFNFRYTFSEPLYSDVNIYARFAPTDDVIGVNVFDSPSADEPYYGYRLVKGDYADFQNPPAFDEENNTFLGWYTDRSLTNEFDFSQPVYDYVYLFPRIVPDENVCWGALYLDSQDQYPVSYFGVEKGDCCPVPAEPGREDEEFKGWYADRALTKPFDFSAPMTADFELFPKFEPYHHHDLVMVDAVRAGQTFDGCKAHYECSGCGKWFEPVETALIEIEDHESIVIPAKGPYLLGDADANDEVESVDATKIQRILCGINVPGLYCRGAADVDGDEEVSSIDVTFIQRYNALINTPFAIGEYVTPGLL